MNPAYFFTARKRSLGQGNIFTRMCHSVHREGVSGCGGVYMVAGGGIHGGRGVCVVVGSMRGCGGWVCVVAGGTCVVAGWCVWLLGGGCAGYDEIRSMSGQYASYWNAFLC